MSQDRELANPFDPMGAWRSARDAYVDAWSRSMVDFVNSEAYAEATGRLLDTYLTMSAPFRKAMESTMTQVLTQLNMPTRGDVTTLAERLINIEMRLDDLDARFDRLEEKLQQARANAPKQRPDRSAQG
jgi:polyhydroxyalkanoic acid synthase PhaR subunit